MEYTKYYTPTTKDLVLQVADGNPGALEVTRGLQWYTKWLQMMVWLANKGIVGAKLWEKYKDEHNQDIHSLGEWIEVQMFSKKEFRYTALHRDGLGSLVG